MVEMKLAFDAKRLFHNHTGLGNYSRSLVREIRALSPGSEMHLFSPSAEKTSYSEFLSSEYKLCLGKNKFLWRLKNMTKDLKQVRPDVYHGLSNELPVGIENVSACKSVVTIHDLIFLHYPNFYPLSDRIVYKEKSKRACQKADHIIAISEATRNDIMEFYSIASEKISVIYQGAGPEFYKEYVNRDIESDDRAYFLFVSSINQRKNLSAVLEALALIPKQDRPLLKVVGRGGRYEEKMKNLVQDRKLETFVEFLGSVDTSILINLYKGAVASIYPSLMEGFGIPIIESQLLGTPVITSNLSSMPEAASGLATLIDPNVVEELKSAILEHLNKPKKLSFKEIEAIRDKFNPTRQAQEVLQLYKILTEK